MDILDLLRSDGSITVNKSLAHEIGLDEAIVLSELIARQKWHESKNETKGGWFYCTVGKLEEQTTLSKYKQSKAINNLAADDLIKKTVKGVPAKRWFYINEQQVINLVTNKKLKNSTSGSKENRQQGVKKTNRSNTNNNKKDNTENKKKKATPIKEIFNLYNDICTSLTNARSLTDKRKRHIKARWREEQDIDVFHEVFEKAEASSFLAGDNDRNWQADLTWIVKNNENFNKILEGKYNDKSSQDGSAPDMSDYDY